MKRLRCIAANVVHNVDDYKYRGMKRIFQILFVLITSSVVSQNIWEPIILSDSLLAYDINAEKDGVLLIGATSNNGLSGLFKSSDDGITWNLIEIDSLIPSNYVNAMCYNHTGILFINTSFGTYKSIDDGDTFEKVSSGIGSIQTMRISPNNSIYGVGWDGIIRSDDYGVTWDTLFDPPNNQYFSDIDFGFNGEIYAVGGKFGIYGTGFYISLDNGLTWSETGPQYGHLQSVRVNSNGTIIVSGFTADKVFHSYDNAATWSLVSNICADVLESYSENRLIAGRNINGHTGCWFSEDWGLSWTEMIDTIINPNVRHISISPTNTVYLQSFYSSSYDFHLFKSINPIVGSNDKTFSSTIELFPNPAFEKISISNNTSNRIMSFTIFNLNGQKVKSGLNLNNEIEVSNLKPGFYIIELGLENDKVIKKILIE